jgi:hypothetical protein
MVYLDDFYIVVYEVTNDQDGEILNEIGNQVEVVITWLEVDNSDVRIQQIDDVRTVISGNDNKVCWYGALLPVARWTPAE